MAELSRYQRQVVKNYYENLDTALVQRLGEQVTDLYLACLLYTSDAADE